MSSTPQSTAAQRLRALRESFDASFSRPPTPARDPGAALLRLRVGGTSIAVRLEHLSGLHLLPRLVRLPGAPATVLGLAGLRGQLIAVHDLGGLLGLSAPEAPPRWLLLAGGSKRVGLAVTDFEGHLRVLQEQLKSGGGATATHPLLNASALLPDTPPLPLLDVDTLVKQLLEQASLPLTGRASP
jgi:purine-binding chemotaxis protein CheW